MFCDGRSQKWEDRGAAAEIKASGRNEERRKGLASVFFVRIKNKIWKGGRREGRRSKIFMTTSMGDTCKARAS